MSVQELSKEDLVNRNEGMAANIQALKQVINEQLESIVNLKTNLVLYAAAHNKLGNEAQTFKAFADASSVEVTNLKNELEQFKSLPPCSQPEC